MNMEFSQPGFNMPPQQPQIPLQPEAAQEPSMQELIEKMFTESNDNTDMFASMPFAYKKKLARGPMKKRKLH